MSIFKRMSDIIGANVNDLLDKAENPQKMIKQIVREMEQGVQTAKRAAAEAMAAEKKLKRELEQNKRLASEWSNKAVQAVDAGRDDLAKKALTRKKEIENLIPSLETQCTQSEEVCANMKSTLKALESRLAEARRRQTALLVRREAAKAQQALAKGTTGVAGDNGLEAFGKFDAMERKVEDEEMKAEAMMELAGDTSDAEFEDLNDSTDIDIELAKLKKDREGKKKSD